MVERIEIEEKVINDLISDYFYKRMYEDEIIETDFNVDDFLYSTYLIIRINDKYCEGNINE